MDRGFKFINTEEINGVFTSTEVKIELDSDEAVCWHDVFDRFVDFMNGCGFSVDEDKMIEYLEGR